MSYCEDAAARLVGDEARQAGGDDWLNLLDVIRDLIRRLMSGCAPTPAEGYDYLTEEFGWFQRLLGADRRRRRAVVEAVRDTGLVDWHDAQVVADDVLAAARDGRLTRDLMAGLYRECR